MHQLGTTADLEAEIKVLTQVDLYEQLSAAFIGVPPPRALYLPGLSWLTGKTYPDNWCTVSAYTSGVVALPTVAAQAVWRMKVTCTCMYSRYNRSGSPTGGGFKSRNLGIAWGMYRSRYLGALACCHGGAAFALLTWIDDAQGNVLHR